MKRVCLEYLTPGMVLAKDVPGVDGGVFLPPSQFEAIFVSAAHSEADIEKTCQVAGDAFNAAARLM